MKNMLLILQVLKNKKNFFSPYRCRFLDGDDYIFLQIRNKHSTHTHTHTAASYINERNKISLPRVWQGKYYQYGNILQQAQRRVCLMFKTERVESQCHLQKWNAKNFHQAKSITASVTRRQKENVEKKKRVLTPGNIYSAEVKATTRERNEKEKIKLCFASLVCVCLLQVTAHGASTQKNTFALHVVVLNFIFPYAWVVRRWLSKKTIKKKRLKKHVAYIYLWPGSVTHWCWHTVELWLCVFEPVSVCVCDTDEFFIRLPIVVMALTSTVTIARCSRAMARRTCERFCCVRASESVWSEKWTVVVVVAIFATVEHTSAFGFALSWIYRRARVLMQSHLVRCQESLIAHFTINRQTDLRQSKRGRQEAFENVIRFLSYYFFLLACFTCIYFFLFFFFLLLLCTCEDRNWEKFLSVGGSASGSDDDVYDDAHHRTNTHSWCGKETMNIPPCRAWVRACATSMRWRLLSLYVRPNVGKATRNEGGGEAVGWSCQQASQQQPQHRWRTLSQWTDAGMWNWKENTAKYGIKELNEEKTKRILCANRGKVSKNWT